MSKYDCPSTLQSLFILLSINWADDIWAKFTYHVTVMCPELLACLHTNVIKSARQETAKVS